MWKKKNRDARVPDGIGLEGLRLGECGGGGFEQDEQAIARAVLAGVGVFASRARVYTPRRESMGAFAVWAFTGLQNSRPRPSSSWPQDLSRGNAPYSTSPDGG